MRYSWLATGNKARIVRNVLFWLVFTWIEYAGRTDFARYYPALLVAIFLSFGVTGYVHNLWLIPKYLLRQRYVVYTLLFVPLFVLTCVLSYYITHYINILVPGLNFMGKKDVAMPYHAFPTVLIFSLMALGKFIVDAIRNQQKMEALEKQRLETELQSLKSQVNPHFLFNALNTIYGMARRTDPQTAKAVIQLSDILRHSLYECEDAEISLEKEILFLRQFVTFAQLRLHEKERIKLEVETAQNGLKIVPLLLMPFVENAIKHGLNRQTYHSWVDIKLRVDDNQLTFTCRNSRLLGNTAINGNNTNGGIGLKNVKRRLELLYPERHRLDIDDQPNEYGVALQLQLS